MAIDTGNGATLTRSGFVVSVVSISIGNQTVGTIDTSLLADTGFMTKISEDLVDAGTVTVEYQFDSATAGNFPTVGGDAVSTVVTFPNNGTTAANLTGTAIITDFKAPDLNNNELQLCSVTFTWDGETGPTFTAES
jgi:hypothetical protein